MYKVTKIDTLNENKLVEEIKLYKDETPVIINEMLYVMDKEEYKKYKNRTLEIYRNSYEEDYIVKCAPYHLEPYEKFVIENLSNDI